MFARRNPKTLKRSVTCENFEECQTRYPLPPNGQITATDAVCEHCGAPMVSVQGRRGPWVLCPNFDCPGREEEEAAKDAKAKAGKSKAKAGKSKSKK